MRITYIRHSGFLVEWKQYALLFDYWRGDIPQAVKDKELYVFSSHKHEDHFNPVIFDLGREREDVHYILSYDIRKNLKRLEPGVIPDDKMCFIRPEEQMEIRLPQGEMMSIRAFHSTDCGVAFLITMDGTSIFHAGDLNRWTWPEDTKQHRNQMIAEYEREIQKLKDIPVTAAFLPLDPRLLEEYDLGVRYFMRHVQVKRIYPMHLWEKYSTVQKSRKSLPKEEREKIAPIGKENRVFEEKDYL